MSLPASMLSNAFRNCLIDEIDDNFADMEQRLADILGVTIDTLYTAALFSNEAAQQTLVGCGINIDIQSLTHNVAAVLASTSENYDPSGMHDNVTNNSRITVPEDGYYAVTASLEFATDITPAGLRKVQLLKNGSPVTNVFDQIPFTTALPSVGFAHMIELDATDYLELQGFQTSGGALNCGGFFEVSLIGVKEP